MPMNTTPPKLLLIRRAVIGILLSIFAAYIVFICWLHISYASNLPDAPDLKNGRIYKMVVNHGFVRYGNENELHTLRWGENMFPFAPVCFLSALILGMRWGSIHIRGSKPNSAKSDTATFAVFCGFFGCFSVLSTWPTTLRKPLWLLIEWPVIPLSDFGGKSV